VTTVGPGEVLSNLLEFETFASNTSGILEQTPTKTPMQQNGHQYMICPWNSQS